MPIAGEEELSRWRLMPAKTAVVLLADFAKPDPTFIPIKDKQTSRWHASVSGRDYELLLTGPKFFDVRANKGGGGAIDFAMHLFSTDFYGAVALLRRRKI